MMNLVLAIPLSTCVTRGGEYSELCSAFDMRAQVESSAGNGNVESTQEILHVFFFFGGGGGGVRWIQV